MQGIKPIPRTYYETGGEKMEFFKYGGISLAALGGLAVLIFAFKTGKPLRALLLNALSGLAVLALVDITTRFTGVHIPVNQWTAGISAGLGVPAVCLFLVLPVMFK